MSKLRTFHEGERCAQEKAGEREEASRNERMIRSEIISQALPFLSKQELVVVGSVDDTGQPWASLVLGEKGFADATECQVVIRRSSIFENPADPVWRNLGADSQVGLLFIDLATRRRLRVNGRVAEVTEAKIQMEVEEAFPNCPKYIQRRKIARPISPVDRTETSPLKGRLIGDDQHRLIARTDTMFVATAHPSRGVDSSHRGGNPGFVMVSKDDLLIIPDYPGNSMFSTLGNLEIDPRAGLVFVDFESSRTLQMTGTATVDWNARDRDAVTGGTRRLWAFEVHRWIESALPKNVRFEMIDSSPFNPDVGEW